MLSSDIEIVEKYYVSREYNEVITPAWQRIKAALAESTNSSHNSDYAKCKCKVPKLPIGFTSMRKSDICCQSCGMHFA